MTLVNKTPKARREALSCCRRCGAMMLVCAMVFAMTCWTAPRAKATAAVGALVAGTGSSVGGGLAVGVGALATPAAALGVGLLAAVGVEFVNGYINGESGQALYSPAVYEKGSELMAYLRSDAVTDAVAAWLTAADDWLTLDDEVGAAYERYESLQVSSEVLELVRQWGLAQFNLGDVVSMGTAGMLTSTGDFVAFTQMSSSLSTLGSHPSNAVQGVPVRLGSVMSFPDLADYSVPHEHVYSIGGMRFTFTNLMATFEQGTESEWYRFVFNVRSNFAGGQFGDGFEHQWLYDPPWLNDIAGIRAAAFSRYFVLGYDDVRHRIYCGSSSGSGEVVFRAPYWIAAPGSVCDIPATMAKTPVLEEEKAEDLVIAWPEDTAFTDVGGVPVPVIGDLTAADVLVTPGTDVGEGDTPVVVPGAGAGITAGEIAGAITDALPVTGSIAGDQVVDEIMGDPDGLGAVFISRFPFCIPWDFVKAVELLASPPVTPVWEFDFLGPMADLVGGFPGDTRIVVDFSDYEVVGQVTRWVSTLGFVYALLLLTKSLVWTS